jgi:hypothetical protein
MSIPRGSTAPDAPNRLGRLSFALIAASITASATVSVAMDVVDRARYDGDRTAAAFAERLREQVDLAGLEADIAGAVDGALRPTSVGVWIRRPGHRGAA